jgi:hypothetical protein
VENLIAWVIIIGGGAFWWRQIAKFFHVKSREASAALAQEKANYFGALRRELANILIWRNPQRYVEIYREIHAEITSYSSWKPEIISQRLADLTLKYPTSMDFDAIGTREYVLHTWGETLSFAKGDDLPYETEIEEHYKNIIRYMSLVVIANPSWRNASRSPLIHLTSDKELEHLTEYSQTVANTQFKVRLAQSLSYAEARCSADERGIYDFDDYAYTVHHLRSFADERYGIRNKKTNEYGIYSRFLFDDGRVRHNFYRSDPQFETEEPLKVIDGKFDELTGYRYEFVWPS